MLQEIPVDSREDAINSMVYETNARLKDPVYCCVALIASLQSQVSQLQTELAMSVAETMAIRAQLAEASSILVGTTETHQLSDTNLVYFQQFSNY
ncbi:hypothetical protein HHK36_023911 [Tetracentron sinense]|uniref:LOB domain-containing protein n=1 Tax=Tetracentron sinense TaxID=13715 RepID=A0A834YR16_TETSI|nr:hypothetical protein HHK36_023911 [Tetracentron sinense]